MNCYDMRSSNFIQQKKTWVGVGVSSGMLCSAVITSCKPVSCISRITAQNTAFFVDNNTKTSSFTQNLK